MRGFLSLMSWFIMIGSSVVTLLVAGVFFVATANGDRISQIASMIPMIPVVLLAVGIGGMLRMLVSIDERLEKSGGPF